MTFISLDTDTARNYAAHIVTAKHNLAASGAFTQESLAALLDRTPDQDVMLCIAPLGTQDTANLPRVERAGRSGEDILGLLKTHCVWLAISNVHNHSGIYSNMVAQLSSELKAQTKLRLYRRRAIIQICSPGVKIPYHCDFQEHSLWQISGDQSACIYPNGPDYLSDDDLDKQALGRDLSYEHSHLALDNPHQKIALSAEHMVAWPFMRPHRIVNGKEMSIALQLEYMTASAWRKYLGLKVRAILRQRMGLKLLRHSRPRQITAI